MSQPIWQFEQSIECEASAGSAWKYWTDVANWNDPLAEFALVGPFEAGSRIVTKMPGQDPWQSVITEVIPDRAATIEMRLQGAVLSFRWLFEALPEHRSRITQRLTLDGLNAAEFLEHMAQFERSVPDGMKVVKAAIEQGV